MAFLSHVVRFHDFLDPMNSPLCWASEDRKGGAVAVVAIDLHLDIRAYIAKRAGSSGYLLFDGSVGTPGKAYLKNGRLPEGGISAHYGPPEAHVLAVLSSSSLAQPIMSALHDRYVKQFGDGYTARMIGR